MLELSHGLLRDEEHKQEFFTVGRRLSEYFRQYFAAMHEYTASEVGVTTAATEESQPQATA